MPTWHEAYSVARWLAFVVAVVGLLVAVADTADCVATRRSVCRSGQNGWMLLRSRARVEAAAIRAGAHVALIGVALVSFRIVNPRAANLPEATVRYACIILAMALLMLATGHSWYRRRAITRAWMDEVSR